MTRSRPIVAIDGPVGAGKTTTARLAAERLGFTYIDTGAMYRAVTFDVLEHGIDPEDESAVAELAARSVVELRREPDGLHTYLGSRDVSERIRDRDVTCAVSAVSAQRAVRERMTELQRAYGAEGGVVMEGRDIGTVVFPDAEFKIYLDATIDVRARRRHAELSAKGREVDLDLLIAEIAERDRSNTERALAPLRKADDAIVVDTSGMTLDGQVDVVVRIVIDGGM